ncbi:MAG TPA: DUF808 domain-containing protein [Polyangiaceae bacterium]|nr:DUF808 domain-containing protein [Polyangiaceae bacterium]
MAGASLLTLLDDIASLLDDVAAMTKVATKKTAGVLGDDLALNAQQVSGVDPSRELPIVWAVAKGSLVNKAILVPSALLLSGFLPVAIRPLLMLGGAYLCFEGFEKVWHKLVHSDEDEAAQAEAAALAATSPAALPTTQGDPNANPIDANPIDANPIDTMEEALAEVGVDVVEYEKDKIRAAVRTDFVLSAEIIVISLGTIEGTEMSRQVATLVAVAIVMTVGVYGLVAAIVKLDDAGLALSRTSTGAARALGRGLLAGAPLMMKSLGVAGTVAMFLVGGQILAHGLPPVHHLIEGLHQYPLAWLSTIVANLLVGVCAGAAVLLLWTLVGRVMRPSARH